MSRSSSPPGPPLRVLAGPSPSQLTDISALVNTAHAHVITSARFEGRVVVHVKGFPGANAGEGDGEYFEREESRGITWSIQVQGRFLQEYSADDVLFGNTFDRPLKLPWGAGAALKFMNFIDPTLEHDLGGPKPWALSPLIATMPHFAHTSLPSQRARLPCFPPPAPESITDDTAQLFGQGCEKPHRGENGHGNGHAYGNGNGHAAANDGHTEPVPRLDTASKRRAYFADARNRRQITFGPQDVLTTDFCYGFLSFPSLSLNLPGGISFDLKKYWDGQPVRFVCVERGNRGGEEGAEGGEEEGAFWCVTIELAECEE